MRRALFLLILFLPIQAFSLLWRTHLGDHPVYCMPRDWEGKIVLVSLSRFYILDQKDGRPVWEYRFRGTELMGFGFRDGLLVVPTIQGFLYLFNLATGKNISMKLKGEFFSLPLIFGPYIILGDTSGELYKIDGKRGRVMWETPLKGPIYTPPVEFNGNIYAGDIRGHFFSLSPGGRITCSFSTHRPGMEGPVVWQNRIAFVSRKTLYVMNPENCRPLWKVKFPVPVVSPPFPRGDRISVCSGREAFLLDRDGKTVWIFRARSRIVAEPYLSKQEVYLVDSDGNLYRLDSETGKLKDFYSLKAHSYCSPLVLKDKIILADMKGEVVALSK